MVVFVENRNSVMSAETVTSTTEHPILRDDYHIMDHVTVNEAALGVGCDSYRLIQRTIMRLPIFSFP